VNGQPALDVNLDDYQDKFAKFPGLARERGHIGLQNFAAGLEFRNIRLREITSDAPPATDPGKPSGANFALEFDGHGAVDVPIFGYKEPQSLTLECWAQPRSAGYLRGLVRYPPFYLQTQTRDGENQPRWHFVIAAPNSQQYYVAPSPPVPSLPTRMVHVAGVFHAGQMELFVDGRKQDQPLELWPGIKFITNKGLRLREFPNGTTINIGGGFGKSEWDLIGIVDEVRVSTTARYSQDFVPERRLQVDADTLALYHCDAGAGDVLHDDSGHGHDGRIVGAKWVRRGE
jgi:hypothetical protein